MGERGARAAARITGIFATEDHESSGIRDRQRLEDEGVHQREDGDIGANPQRQRNQCDAGDNRRLAQVAEVWEKLHRAARDVEMFRLDRKPMVFAVFGLLAETVRR